MTLTTRLGFPCVEARRELLWSSRTVAGSDRFAALEDRMPVYAQLLEKLRAANAQWLRIDGLALGESPPLRLAQWAAYPDWAVQSFRLPASGVRDETHVHTHMCHPEFNDIIKAVPCAGAAGEAGTCQRARGPECTIRRRSPVPASPAGRHSGLDAGSIVPAC